MKRLVIIGAGLAGLAAGVYAQRNGYQTRIFEHASQPGGVAVSWRRGEYTIDGGIHFLMGHRPGQSLYGLYQQLGTAGPDTCVDLADYGDFMDESSGRRLAVTADLARFADDWRAISPDDGSFAERIVRGADAFRRAGAFDIGMGEPPELAGPLASARMLWEMRRVLPYFTGEPARPMGELAPQIQDPFLRAVYCNLFLPEVPAWFLYMLLALLADGQLGLLKRGSTGFVAPIAERFRQLGGELTCGATVEQILVEEDAAAGVRLAGGRVERADAVISAADGYSTIFEMLGGRYADEAIRTRYRDWPLIRPMVMLSYGVRRSFAGEPHLRVFQLAEPLAVGPQAVPQAVSALMLRIFNYSDHFAPPGKTVIQATFDAEWDYWRSLRDEPPAYEAVKARLAGEVLARLERHYPGLSAQVEVTDVATPYTTWRYTRNRQGAYEGWLPTPRLLMTALPRTLPGLRRFAMAGQWVVPGGVPTCLLSGRDAVRILCRQDGVTFRPD